jgi:hypothetical protein
MDISGFLSALSESWVALMSGIASVVLAFTGVLYGFVWKKDLPARALWSAALVCFFIASIKVWTIEHTARLSLEKHLQELTAPKLFGSIVFVSVASATDPKDSVVTLLANIKNTGAPSIADSMSVKIRLKNGREIRLASVIIPPSVTLSSDDSEPRSIVLLRDNYLPTKAMSQPIVNGAAVTGWTWGLAKGASKDEVIEPGTIIILFFTDVTGKYWEISKTMTGQGFGLIDPNLLQKKPQNP